VHIPVYIHDRQVAPDFVPEHLESLRQNRPGTLLEFLADVGEVTRCQPTFRTLDGDGTFHAAATEQGDLQILGKESQPETIPSEELESAWSAMQTGLLTGDLYSGEAARRYKAYLFAILACLPYVLQAEVQPVRNGKTGPEYALFFRPSSTVLPVASEDAMQLALWR